MKALIASALVVALAGPAAAGNFAIDHFNQDKTGNERVMLVGDTVVSTKSSAQANVFARFNADADTQDGVRGLNGATLVSGTPANSGDVFARIKAEGLENE